MSRWTSLVVIAEEPSKAIPPEFKDIAYEEEFVRRESNPVAAMYYFGKFAQYANSSGEDLNVAMRLSPDKYGTTTEYNKCVENVKALIKRVCDEYEDSGTFIRVNLNGEFL